MIPYRMTCIKKSTYNEEFDAYYCAGCDKWIEPMCNDEYCEFCVSRPDKPLKGKEGK